MTRSLFWTLAPGLLSVIAFVLITTALFGQHSRWLDGVYFLEVDVSKMSIPPKLGESSILNDISTVSGTDYTGQNSTANSLGVASRYTVGLLTACGRGNGTSSCMKSYVGYYFNIPKVLRFSATSLQGNVNGTFMEAMESYKTASAFMSSGLIASNVFNFLVSIVGWFSPRGAGVMSGISTCFAICATIAAIVVFNKFDNAIIATYSRSIGLTSSLGTSAIVITCVAAFISLLASILYVSRSLREDPARQPRRIRNRPVARSAEEKSMPLMERDNSYNSYNMEGIEVHHGATDSAGQTQQKSGLMGFMGGKHNYVQVEKQVPQGGDGIANQPVSTLGLPQLGPRLDDDWEAPDEYTQKRKPIPSPPRLNIPGNRQTRDLSASYEPYTSTTTRF
ncbi:hypothetical protein QBC32DRAFT_16036 [Pseudoneurospora amorphoporcata]|uniref:SUR7 protein n=1 Tax=Pseudoneurospora amorphoporcata TaxID=241081 RepID=A0AAN6P592_9PEZI|nr:hypothetical protein QBC32DRAFT_16036 [Pseudoneurospora amorphoporcata]